ASEAPVAERARARRRPPASVRRRRGPGRRAGTDRSGRDPGLEHPAEPSRVRPRPEAATGRASALGCPDLLERRPVIGRALAQVEGAPVPQLEADVHLEPAVVRPAAVRPRRLVAVDAEPGRVVRRVDGAPVGADRAAPPDVPNPALVAPAGVGPVAERAPR